MSRFYAYLRAYLTVLDDGKAVTVTELARTMGLSRETVHRLHVRYPDLLAWVAEQLRDIAFHQRALVQAKVTSMALRGSLKAASLVHAYDELAAKVAQTAADRRSALDAPAGAPGGFQVNILVPRPPEMAVVSQGPYRVPAAVLDQAVALPVPADQQAAFVDPLAAVPVLKPHG